MTHFQYRFMSPPVKFSFKLCISVCIFVKIHNNIVIKGIILQFIFNLLKSKWLYEQNVLAQNGSQ